MSVSETDRLEIVDGWSASAMLLDKTIVIWMDVSCAKELASKKKIGIRLSLRQV